MHLSLQMSRRLFKLLRAKTQDERCLHEFQGHRAKDPSILEIQGLSGAVTQYCTRGFIREEAIFANVQKYF